MANNLDIEERTLAEISEATNTINTLGETDSIRLTWDQPLVCRVTDHDDDTTAEADDADLMAIFKSSAHGQPWLKDANVLIHKVVQADADPVTNATDSDVSVLFPNFDYTAFE